MNPPSDDEYAGLSDLFGDEPERDHGSGPAEGADGPADPRAGTDLPPGVPAEYAEAYRLGYERARREEDEAREREPTEPVEPTPQPAPRATEPTRQAATGPEEPTQQIRLPHLGERTPRERASGQEEPTQVLRVPLREERDDRPVPAPWTPRDPAPGRQDHAAAAPAGQSAGRTAAAAALGWLQNLKQAAGERGRDRRAVAIALAALALVVVGAAFGLGRLLADATGSAGGGGTTQTAGGAGRAQHARPVYRGPLERVPVADASATCQSPPAVDAAGDPVSYEPARVYDSDLTTAWRCNGSGVGQRLTITLSESTTVAEVGLVPGYAKTDPVSGADRYAENNRITEVRWRFDDGSTYVQRMSGSAANRSMRVLRVPATPTRHVVLEILASRPGPRHTVAISEVRIASPRR